MKAPTICLLLLTSSLYLHSQSYDIRKFTKESLNERVVDSMLNTYDTSHSEVFITIAKKEIFNKKVAKVIDEKLLKENLDNAFNSVIFSNSNLVSNSSAFGYSQNEEKTTISSNVNIRLSEVYLKAGVNAEGSNTIFNLYSDESWRNNVGANLGLIIKFKGATFYKHRKQKDKLNWDRISAQRRNYVSKPIYQKDKYSIARLNAIEAMLKEADAFIRNPNQAISSTELKTLIKKKGILETQSILYQERNNLVDYLNAINQLEDRNSIEYVQKQLYEFDKKNDITQGYSFHWIDLNYGIKNSSYTFGSDQIADTISANFEGVYDFSKAFNNAKHSVSINYNYTRNDFKKVIFLQGGLSYHQGSILENDLIDGTPTLNDTLLIFQDDNENSFGQLSELESENVETGSFNFYIASFFGKQKNIGFNVNIAHQYLIGSVPTNYYFQNNFTLLFGPIFRKVKDENTSLTFGVDVGWQNAIYNTQVNDDFVARIRVGIPFNVYNKKEGEEINPEEALPSSTF